METKKVLAQLQIVEKMKPVGDHSFVSSMPEGHKMQTQNSSECYPLVEQVVRKMTSRLPRVRASYRIRSQIAVSSCCPIGLAHRFLLQVVVSFLPRSSCY